MTPPASAARLLYIIEFIQTMWFDFTIPDWAAVFLSLETNFTSTVIYSTPSRWATSPVTYTIHTQAENHLLIIIFQCEIDNDGYLAINLVDAIFVETKYLTPYYFN